MKKILSIVLLMVCVFVTTSVAAGSIDGFRKYVPSNIDLSSFENDNYGIVFDSFKYEAFINSKTLFKGNKMFRFGNGSAMWNYKTRLDIIMTSDSTGNQQYTPRFITDGYTKHSKTHLEDIYILIGEHRYKFDINQNGIMTLGKNGFSILEEIIASSEPAFITFEGLTTDSFDLFEEEALEIISNFIEDCKKSGIYDLLPQQDDSSIILFVE